MRVGFVGWRGMVGSVLLQRMHQEGDLDRLSAAYFSTSNAGGRGPDGAPLLDAHDVQALAQQEVVVTCQGGEWTTRMYPALRASGWTGIWIDAARALRMEQDAVLVLDPVNGEATDQALHSGVRTFVGANCSVSLLLMGLVGLLRSGHVRWVSTMTYQSASGAGARNMRELVAQMRAIGNDAAATLDDPARSILDLDQTVAGTLGHAAFPTQHFGAPLAGSAIPWIDVLTEHGQTREEWKGMAEANKLLGRQTDPIPVDGICVRIGAMRCHAQAVTLELDADVPLDEIEDMIRTAHPWTDVVPNDRAATLARLTPAATAGTLMVPVGRLRKMRMGPRFVTAFTVGDQLLWGAAEPLRCMLERVVMARS